MTAIRWTGMNCGIMTKIVSNKDFMASLEFFDAIDPKVSALAFRPLKFQLEKASSADVACQPLIETLLAE